MLAPIWVTKPATARKLRQRIRATLSWCQAHGYVEHNWAGEAINGALPAMPTVRAHFRALPYRDVPDALAVVAAADGSLVVKLCLRFLILTVSRSGEARGATWDEVSLDGREWRIPANRMKAGAEHRVPLSDQCVDVLERVALLRDESGLVFPSPTRGSRPLSDMTLMKTLRATGLAERTTVHGFRSAFRDWASECTEMDHAVIELSLAHKVGSAVERAYARSDLIEKRRQLMAKWGAFASREAQRTVGSVRGSRKRKPAVSAVAQVDPTCSV
ncbi:MAG: site-specific integrase [Gammaproteobacteria bacterium]|nr:site-specific integrase [Gammaproteobacteria bacterium]